MRHTHNNINSLDKSYVENIIEFLRPNFLSNVFILVIFSFIFSSCQKLVEIDPPKNALVPITVFKNDALATSAVLGIYQQMAASGYASGGSNSISAVCGVSSDELIGYSTGLMAISENQNNVFKDL